MKNENLMTDAQRINDALSALDEYDIAISKDRRDKLLAKLRQLLTKEPDDLNAPKAVDIPCPSCAMRDRQPNQPIQCNICRHTGVVSNVATSHNAAAFLEKYLWDFISLAGAFPECKPDDRIWDHVLAYMPVRVPLPEFAVSLRNNLPQTASLLAVIKQLKVRLAYIGWPEENYWEAQPGNWVPDWRRESNMLNNALHGTPLNEQLWNNPPSQPRSTLTKNGICVFK